MRIAFLAFLLLASVTYAAGPGDEGVAGASGLPSCSVKAACNATEVCWFSVSNTTDAHISDCTNDPYTYKLCCSNAYPATIRTSCNPGEIDMITYSSATGDAHLSDPFDPYGQHVCVSPQTSATLLCSVKARSEQGSAQCEITLSGEYDAHAADCSDPYDYGLYCDAGVTSAYAPHTLTVSVKPNNLANAVYIEGEGTRQANQLQTTSYSSWYALSYQGRNVVGVASFRPQERDIVKTSQGTSQHEIALEQPVQRNRAFVIMTRADVDQVQSILGTIDSPTDANQVNFGYANEQALKVNVGIESNAVIDIQGNETMLPGTYRVEIKKVDQQNYIQVVRIKKE